MITLTSKLPKGKFKGKTINELQSSELSMSEWCNNRKYICWIINNWSDKFDITVMMDFGYDARMAREYPSGSNPGVTNDSCWDNLH